MQNYYYPIYFDNPIYRQIPVHNDHDQRFFPLLLPFVAGLAIGPFLFNRPYFPPYPPYPPMYPPYLGYGGYPYQQPPYAPTQISENINIFTN